MGPREGAEQSMKKRVLVTGGAGFVGSHLCEYLLERGYQVIALDDLSTGAFGNIAHLVGSRSFRFIEHDVVKPFDISVDRIYNLACPASPVHYQHDPIKTMLTNVLGALHGLRLAQKCRARFLQASTSEVYGDPLVHPQPESYLGNVNPIGVRACYDEGKRCAETLAMDFRRRRDVHVRVARIFNTYGPRMALDDGRVVSNFVTQALSGEDITVYGDGSQTRSFCYVSDLVAGLFSLMEHPTETGPLNLGNPTEFTVLELAREVIELSGSKSRIVFRSLPEDDPKLRRPCIDKATQRLNFMPLVPLRAGLLLTIESFRKKRELDATPSPLVAGAG
jgi:UDP-glucuronate decarboxylase